MSKISAEEIMNNAIVHKYSLFSIIQLCTVRYLLPAGILVHAGRSVVSKTTTKIASILLYPFQNNYS